ncbi:MAG: hypothetical protein R2875_05550 [Desulfobacterales bacterium]
MITSGGIHGQITALDENTVTLEIAEKVRIKGDPQHSCRVE